MNGSEELNIGKNIKKYRNLKGLTQKDLSGLANISRSYLGDIENGRYNPSLDTLGDIAGALNMDVNELIGDNPERNSVKIPVLGRIAAGIPIEAITEIIDYEEIPKQMLLCGEYFALQIVGDSMEPKFSERDVVIVKKQSSVQTGEIAIVLVNGEDATIKKISLHETGINLIPTNPIYSPRFYTNDEILKLPVEVLGKVVELRAKF